jgi:NodT family efflux transporter outer membrane factor (OMF) lipoprotein
LIIKGKIAGRQAGAGLLLRRLAAGWIVSAGLLLGGCMVGPDYQRPRVNLPAGYGAQAAPPEGWKLAQPAEEAALNPAANPASGADALRWWRLWQDEGLARLVESVEVNNQNVLAAQAQLRQALAVIDASRASLYPAVTASLPATRAQGVSSSTTGSSVISSGATTRNTVRLSSSVSWEADLWGRIGRNIEAGEASAQASAADLAATLLSARATLVQSWLQWRMLGAQLALLERSIAAYERALQITRNRFEAGVAQRSDVSQAESQLQGVLAQRLELGLQRLQLQNAMAVLLGRNPGSLAAAELESLAADATRLPVIPEVPLGLPSALLERRPDVAAAERRVAAANAQIGVARAAFFPTLTLGGTLGYQNTRLAELVNTSNRFWSLGPTLAMTLFDAGARSAQQAQAAAAWDKSVASYRQTVLTALQEVEDNLAAVRWLEQEQAAQRKAADAAAETLVIAQNQYLAGTVSYLNVVTAQSASLGAERAVLDIALRRMNAGVALVRALGGGWK